MDHLVLNNMQFHAFHGVYEQEQKVGNTYIVDLKIGADLSLPCKTDQLKDSINYASIFAEIQEEMKNRCNLIEHLAENLCQRIKRTFLNIQSIEIKVTKINPPLQGQIDSVSVILVR
jgi:7,8-dihydroneopterin aldolase/epimerase/oxygenase